MTRQIRKEIENKIHRLRNQFPCGIRSIDDNRDAEIARLQALLKDDIQQKVEYLNRADELMDQGQKPKLYFAKYDDCVKDVMSYYTESHLKEQKETY